MKTLTIDPSVRSCGWAFWDNDRLKASGLVRSSHKDDDWQTGGQGIGAVLRAIGRRNKIDKVYCEFPAFHGGTKGAVTASSGALVKLSWMVGFLDGLFTPEFIPFELVPVNKWKGQLPKEVINERIKKILPESVWKNFKKDTWDAVGLGLFIHGRMK